MARLTPEQFLALPDEYDNNGNHIKDELIGGVIVRTPPSSHTHDRIKNRINRLLILFLDTNPHLGLDSLVEMAAEVSTHDAFVPDVCVFHQNRLTEDSRIQRGAPDIAIEVVSPRDTAAHLKRKVDAYLQSGSKAVWVVFPDSHSVMVHTADSVRELKGNQQIENPLLPGFSTPSQHSSISPKENVAQTFLSVWTLERNLPQIA
jgi:Uma2 family endonuclease